MSKDQTARLFAEWQKTHSYFEIGRPQVHGHDLFCLTFQENATHRFASGAEEKTLRIFEAPKVFFQTLKNLVGIDYKESSIEERASTANVPALGLSNKPVFESTSTMGIT